MRTSYDISGKEKLGSISKSIKLSDLNGPDSGVATMFLRQFQSSGMTVKGANIKRLNSETVSNK